MKNRKKLFGGVLITSTAAIALTLGVIAFKHGALKSAEADAYTLTLNNSNGITGSNVTTTKNIWTDSHAWEVPFDYKNCSALNEGHATILGGGTIVNKEHIRSIYNVTATFSTSGALKFRTSYDGATWGGYTTMTSTENYPLGSNPYYIEFSTDGSHSVDVTSIKFSYSCLENPTATGTEVSTNDTWERISGNTDLKNGDQIVVTASYSSLWFSLQDDLEDPDRDYWLDAEPITLSSDKETATVTSSNHVWTVLTGTQTGTWKLKHNNHYLKAAVDSESHYNIGLTETYDSTTCDWTFLFTNSNPSMGCNGVYLILKRYQKSSTYYYEYAGNSSSNYYRYIYKRVAGETHTEYETPVDENGFTVSDANKDSYSTKSIFDSANGLTVRATYTDGSYQTLSKGGANGYSYVVKNSLNENIDTSKAFPSVGTYRLYVNYKDYMPSVTEFTVGEHYKTVTPKLTTTSFNTADIMSQHLAGNLSAELINESNQKTTVSYEDFASYNLTVKLLNPNNVEQSMNSAFGTAGDWKIRVINGKDTAVYGDTTVTVSPILVTDITLSNASISLTKGDTRTLTVTSVLPDNATNKEVTWSSSKTSVATVSSSGVVTAVDVGTATIRATAKDGSAVYGECTVTVTPSLDWELVTNVSSLSAGTKVVIANSAQGVTAGDISSQIMGSVSSTFSQDKNKITSLGTGTQVFTLSKSSANWTFTNASSQLLGATAVKKLAWGSGTTTWSISVSSNNATIQSTTESYGKFLYNVTSPRFTTYASDPTFNMLLPQLYALPSDPVYPEDFTIEDVVNDSMSMTAGSNKQIVLNYTNSGVNQRINLFESSNETVAEVSESGVITAKTAGNSTITVKAKSSATEYITKTFTLNVTSVNPTSVTLSDTTLSIGKNNTATLTAVVAPFNASNKAVTWSSSNTSVATVNSSTGLITGKSAGSATITATTVLGNKSASCNVTVKSASNAEWTIMFYVCGADLESGTDDYGNVPSAANAAGYASMDIDEILSANKPSNVNVIFETGGANIWQSGHSYSISKSVNERWHVGNSHNLVKDSSLSDLNMGDETNFQSFLEWGFNNYPAQKYGLFMWNHGGAIDGVCFDEKHDGDSLTADEVANAVSGAKSKCHINNKLEFIGYDACLMAVQDIAELNSDNFNYMICSQESEYAGGYDYDAWLPSLYNSPTTANTGTVLTSVASTFMDEQNSDADNWNNSHGYTPSSSNYWPHDQTQSVLNLNYMAQYKEKFESFASGLSLVVNTTSKWSSFASLMKSSSVKEYGDSQYDIYNITGEYSMFSALRADSTYSSLYNIMDDVDKTLENMLVYEEHGSDTYGCGLCVEIPCRKMTYKSDYNKSTRFTTWYNFVSQSGYGQWR